MTQKLLIVILCLAFATLACLSTGEVRRIDAREVRTSPTLTNAPAAASTITATAPRIESPVQVCAVVIADTAQNLRSGADPNAQILTWLKNGDVVQVMDQSDAAWWRVKRGDDVGFARLIFLEVVECER